MFGILEWHTSAQIFIIGADTQEGPHLKTVDFAIIFDNVSIVFRKLNKFKEFENPSVEKNN